MGPESYILVILWSALTLYLLFGGADFGVGIWEVNTALQATEKERNLLYKAIGPVWEANHVWLIFFLVGTHAAFPRVYAALGQALWVPLLIAIVGIVFRGAAYAFRSNLLGQREQRTLWEAVFAVASTVAPFFLGAAAGAVASGKLDFNDAGEYQGDILTGWISPLSLFTGFFTVGVCAFLSATYLLRESVNQQLEELTKVWRQRALATGIWMGVLSLVGVAFLAVEPESFWTNFRERGLPLFCLGVASGVAALVAIWFTRPLTATIAAASTVSCVIWGWGVSQYPVLLPPNLTIENCKTSDSVMWAMLWTIGIGMVIVVPSLWWLFAIFKSADANATGKSSGY
jgi:cytochrome d ubiquinol oxidase subunit II